MRTILGAALAALLLSTPANATILLDTTGIGGTGVNVTFDSVASSNLILGHLNGQNNEIVRFRDLSGNGAFTGAANGNDIKIFNTSDLDVTVWNSLNTTQLGVVRDVFSIVGTGTMLFHVTALEADGTFKNFNFSSVLANGQNGFDFRAIDGERIWDLDLVNIGGSITDFEHFRIDVAQVAAVPLPAVGSGFPMLIAGIGGLVALQRRRKARRLATA